MESIHQFNLMKIDQKANRNVEQFHIAQQLGFMDGQDFVNALQFEQQAVLDENVKAQGFLENQSFVFDFDDPLIDGRDLAQAQFLDQTFFINALDETGSFEPVNLNGRTDGRVAQLIGFREQGMHSANLQKHTTKTKQEKWNSCNLGFFSPGWA